jgi:pimeloyl-ACP methyl ester carboxylesterase
MRDSHYHQNSNWTGFISGWKLWVGLVYICVRVVQRLYYHLRGVNRFDGYTFDADAELDSFLAGIQASVSKHTIASSKDAATVRYDRIGTGSKFVCLANGIGTRLWIWLPVLRELISQYPALFDEITLIVPLHRGLFDENGASVDISIANCAHDVLDVMKHASIKQFHTIIGWSVGTQIALALESMSPTAYERSLLLCPSTGKTLEPIFQPLVRWFPKDSVLARLYGEIMTFVLRCFHDYLVPGYFYTALRFAVYDSYAFRIFADTFAACTGLSPEIGAYGTAYFKDVLSTRTHAQSLIRLICSLNAPIDLHLETTPKQTIIMTAYGDVFTGVYFGTELAAVKKGSKHTCMLLASHFLLLEFQDLLATEILKLVFGDVSKNHDDKMR